MGFWASGYLWQLAILISESRSVTEKSNERYVRYERINSLIGAFGRAVSYLEIGVETGKTLFAVDATERVGVDPFPAFSEHDLPADIEFHTKTSDAFFLEIEPSKAFDIVLVDGLHHWQQALLDIQNSFSRLRPGGVVLVDDVLPVDEISAHPSESFARKARKDGVVNHDFWYGDTWKALLAIDLFFTEIQFVVMGNRSLRNHGVAFLWRNSKSSNKAIPGLTESQIEQIEATRFESFFTKKGVPTAWERVFDFAPSYRKIVERAAI